MKKWKTLKRIEKTRSIIFKHEVVERSSDSGLNGLFDVVHCLNWVNVIAITKNDEVLLVKQYRHGVNEITYETPGGAVEPGEDTLLAAKRELQEETGYGKGNWSKLGVVDVNPAFMSNRCSFYLAEDVEEVSPMNLDQLEEIELEKRSLAEIKKMIKQGEISHSLVVSAFYYFDSR